MKKTHTLLLALFLCLALIFPCALAEDAYVPGQRTQALIDAALDAGQIVGGETRLTLQLGDEILSMLADDEENQAQLDALMEVIGGIRLAGGFGKLEDGYRVELGGSYTAPSGDNVFVTAAANLTLDGVSIESNLIEGERLSIRWETLLRLFGLTDDEVNQIMALRDVDWDNAMEELSTVVAQAAEEIAAEAVGKFKKRFNTLPVRVSVPDELLMVPMDATLIEQVLINLMENAVLHAEGATEIELRIRREGDLAQFSVLDNGAGIEPAVLPKLFEEMFPHAGELRGDGRRSMGIGLSVCMSIVRAHGGTMKAENRATGGACVSFALPMEEE